MYVLSWFKAICKIRLFSVRAKTRTYAGIINTCVHSSAASGIPSPSVSVRSPILKKAAEDTFSTVTVTAVRPATEYDSSSVQRSRRFVVK